MEGNKRKQFRSGWMRMMPALIVLAVFSTACGSGGAEEQAAAVEETRTVAVEKVGKSLLTDGYELSGTLRADEETLVSFEADGRILEAGPEIGDFVKAGATLAKLDAAPYQLQLDRANAAVQQAQAAVLNADAALQSAQASVANAEAQVKSAQAGVQQVEKGARKQELQQAQNAVDLAKAAYEQAKKDSDRVKDLYENELATLTDYENAQLGLSKAEKDLNNAQAQLSLVLEGATDEQRLSALSALEQAQAGKNAALAALKQAQAGKAQAEAGYKEALTGKNQAALGLSKTTLTSPVSGVVIEKMARLGELTGAGQPAYRIGKVDKLSTLLSVPDSEISAWKVGQKVELALYGTSRTGTVARIYPSTNEATGSISVEISIPNPNRDWTPGQVVSASRQGEGKQGIAVPVEAVLRSGDNPYVFTYANGAAVKKEVRLGKLYGNRLEIVSGLREGEQIIVKGAVGLFDGDKLQLAEESAK